ncbi:MAG: hypothetical protein ACXQS8_00270 [Candidatus Helarchaeales archaeon]
MSIAIDFDFLFSSLAKNHNHRRLPSHGIFLHAILLGIGIPLLFFNVRWVFLIGIAGVVHVLLDVIDWGTFLLTPLKRDLLVGGILPSPDEKSCIPQCYFTLTYYSSKKILALEIILGVIAFLFLLLFSPLLILLMLGYVLFLAFHLMHFVKCRQEKKQKELETGPA